MTRFPASSQRILPARAPDDRTREGATTPGAGLAAGLKAVLAPADTSQMDSEAGAETPTDRRASRRLSIAVQDATDPMRVMQRVVDEVLLLIPEADSAVVELADDDTLKCVCSAGDNRVGYQLPLDSSLSGVAVRTKRALRCDDTETDDRVNLDVARRVKNRSLVKVPLFKGEAVFGALGVGSSRARAFDDSHVSTLARLGEFVTVVLGAAADLNRVATAVLSETEPAAADHLAISEFVAHVVAPAIADDLGARKRVEETLREKSYSTVFQPIFDLDSGAMVAVEALSRFDGPPEQPPDRWFADAEVVGLGWALELAVLRRAISELPGLPEDCRMAVNIGPETVMQPLLQEILRDAPAERITLELTEHGHVGKYDELRRVIARLRSLGVKLAVDDTGAGCASLAHIVKLAPDIIKLDRDFTIGVDADPVRRGLATAVVSFALDIGAQVVAEGIETECELETLCSLGVEFGQGFLLGMPVPLDELDTTSQSDAVRSLLENRRRGLTASLRSRLTRSKQPATV